jgi:multiple sugar transport system permease protein
MKVDKKFVFTMLTPTIIIMVVLTLFPIIYNIANSFTDFYYLSHSGKKIVGFNNYSSIIKDPYFQQALYNTLKFMVFAVIIETALGLAYAVLVRSLKRGESVIRTLILLPNLLPPVTVALVWQMMLSNEGLFNHVLAFFNIEAVNWLGNISTAFWAILIIDIWQWTPFVFLVLYAMLLGVPVSQYEAAQIDGAGGWGKFKYITLPNIFSGILLVLLLRTIDSIRLFDKVNILTKGGPANTTATISQYIYKHGISNLKVGYGAAASIIMVLMVLVIAVIYVKRTMASKQL